MERLLNRILRCADRSGKVMENILIDLGTLVAAIIESEYEQETENGWEG